MVHGSSWQCRSISPELQGSPVYFAAIQSSLRPCSLGSERCGHTTQGPQSALTSLSEVPNQRSLRGSDLGRCSDTTQTPPPSCVTPPSSPLLSLTREARRAPRPPLSGIPKTPRERQEGGEGIRSVGARGPARHRRRGRGGREGFEVYLARLLQGD